MELKSIASLVFKVKDLDRTAVFYDSIGFRAGNREANRYTIYLNWFSVEFQVGEPAPGGSEYVCIKVDNADKAFNAAKEKGLEPSRTEADLPWNHGEFVLCDPDGYKLVFFDKK